ncbi:hypothetical protein [Rhizobium ruizarguesonis]|uniref:hypothetical protein n=1 Tax=Rhizobium ruizarguesonis TaxID=2081791 RepID=UPI001CF5737A|nr:hypothetical protein [Rhizobium ruizarguesonis]MCB2403571.1 hypothetical protein [Rhizobium ruizarguesonis]
MSGIIPATRILKTPPLCYKILNDINDKLGLSMRQTITRIRGLTVNVEVVEVCQMDQNGGILCYVAAIYAQQIGSLEKRLVRKSRLPGAAAALKAEVQRDGIRFFEEWKR